MRAAEWAAGEAHRHKAPLLVVSAAVQPLRAHDTDRRTVASQLCGESALRSARPSRGRPKLRSRLVIDASLLIGPPTLAVTDSGCRSARACRRRPRSRGIPRDAARARSAGRRPCTPAARSSWSGRGRASTCALRSSLASATRRTPRLWHSHSTTQNCAGRPWSSSTPGTGSRSRPGGRPIPARLAAEADKNLAEVLEPWRGKCPAVSVRQDLVHDHAARVLACYSSRADLVVIGRHASSAGPAVGGIQHAVLSHARGPIAIVPSGLRLICSRRSVRAGWAG